MYFYGYQLDQFLEENGDNLYLIFEGSSPLITKNCGVHIATSPEKAKIFYDFYKEEEDNSIEDFLCVHLPTVKNRKDLIKYFTINEPDGQIDSRLLYIAPVGFVLKRTCECADDDYIELLRKELADKDDSYPLTIIYSKDLVSPNKLYLGSEKIPKKFLKNDEHVLSTTLRFANVVNLFDDMESYEYNGTLYSGIDLLFVLKTWWANTNLSIPNLTSYFKDGFYLLVNKNTNETMMYENELLLFTSKNSAKEALKNEDINLSDVKFIKISADKYFLKRFEDDTFENVQTVFIDYNEHCFKHIFYKALYDYIN